jgi:AhpD family alkylhydroperoxidase
MDSRLDIYSHPITVKYLKRVSASYRAISDSPLPASTVELVSLRVSQINGCGFCVDMHNKELAHAGESPLRIGLVAAWRESNVFTDAERAALELAEQGTRMADASAGVSDEAWANAAAHYDEDQLAALICLISFMNTVNRMNRISRQHGGDYKVGWAEQWG